MGNKQLDNRWESGSGGESHKIKRHPTVLRFVDLQGRSSDTSRVGRHQQHVEDGRSASREARKHDRRMQRTGQDRILAESRQCRHL